MFGKFLVGLIFVAACHNAYTNYVEGAEQPPPPVITTTSTTSSDDILVREPHLPVPRWSPQPTTVDVPSSDIASVLDIDNHVIEFTGTHATACTPGYVTDGNAYYCPTDDTIYIGKNWISQFPYPVQLSIYAHEDGHSEDPNKGQQSEFQSEQYADWYSGVRVRQLRDNGTLSDADVKAIRAWIASIPSSSSHGTGQQRMAAFNAGYYS